ncbi:MAG: hypothetical protein ACKPKO_05905 [Candidatus Fonsibacter sp.]
MFELVGASYRQLLLLLADDPVVVSLDSRVSRPVLQQSLVLGSVVFSGFAARCASLSPAYNDDTSACKVFDKKDGVRTDVALNYFQ